MTKRNVGLLCVQCEWRGWRSTVFDDFDSILRHSARKHPMKHGSERWAHVEVACRRVGLVPHGGEDDEHGTNQDDCSGGTDGGNVQPGSEPQADGQAQD